MPKTKTQCKFIVSALPELWASVQMLTWSEKIDAVRRTFPGYFEERQPNVLNHLKKAKEKLVIQKRTHPGFADNHSLSRWRRLPNKAEHHLYNCPACDMYAGT